MGSPLPVPTPTPTPTAPAPRPLPHPSLLRNVMLPFCIVWFSSSGFFFGFFLLLVLLHLKKRRSFVVLFCFVFLLLDLSGWGVEGWGWDGAFLFCLFVLLSCLTCTHASVRVAFCVYGDTLRCWISHIPLHALLYTHAFFLSFFSFLFLNGCFYGHCPCDRVLHTMVVFIAMDTVLLTVCSLELFFLWTLSL